MALAIESIASVGVLVANAVFIIVSVATYLRMNTHEQRRQDFIVRALNDTREAGRDLKAVARSLERLLERAERMRAWQRVEPGESMSSWPDSLPQEEAEPEPDLQRLRPLESLNGLSAEDYAEWRRLHQVELDRVLNQRRRLQAEVAALRERAARERRQPERARGEAGEEALDAEALSQLRQQLEALQAQLQRSLVEKDFIEERLLRLDASERRLREDAEEPS
ncbi:hypothetical protein [Roseateles violae]|uniref:Uncharacterized protein n=1 Tax=Roseateles violae TaxID=3058042 RepID=A0ABT8DVS3_9BURK|nr:hypothetical protein [Pelomonas sp. PFR6]MDN3920251.1 hypothetical protein [Pelomonas sp. PFR6]